MFFVLILLLIQPPGNGLPQVSQYDSAEVRYSPNIIQKILIETEIIDLRESNNIFCVWQDIFVDGRIVIRRIGELWDCPYSHESDRFPTRDLINEMLYFNKKYVSHLESCMLIWQGTPHIHCFYETCKKESDYLYNIWDLTRDTKSEYYHVYVRRAALKKLKIELDKINSNAWRNGELPPPFPTWRFQKISGD